MKITFDRHIEIQFSTWMSSGVCIWNAIIIKLKSNNVHSFPNHISNHTVPLDTIGDPSHQENATQKPFQQFFQWIQDGGGQSVVCLFVVVAFIWICLFFNRKFCCIQFCIFMNGILQKICQLLLNHETDIFETLYTVQATNATK